MQKGLKSDTAEHNGNHCILEGFMFRIENVYRPWVPVGLSVDVLGHVLRHPLVCRVGNRSENVEVTESRFAFRFHGKLGLQPTSMLCWIIAVSIGWSAYPAAFNQSSVQEQIAVAVDPLLIPISPEYCQSQFRFRPARPVLDQKKQHVRNRRHLLLPPTFPGLFLRFCALASRTSTMRKRSLTNTAEDRTSQCYRSWLAVHRQ